MHALGYYHTDNNCRKVCKQKHYIQYIQTCKLISSGRVLAWDKFRLDKELVSYEPEQEENQ